MKFKLPPKKKKTKWEGCFILDLSIPSMLTVLSPHFIFKMQTSVNANHQGQDGPGLDLEGRACFAFPASGNCQSSGTAAWACGQWDQQQAVRRRMGDYKQDMVCVCPGEEHRSSISSLNMNEAPVPTLWQLLGMQLVQRKQCTRKTFFLKWLLNLFPWSISILAKVS